MSHLVMREDRHEIELVSVECLMMLSTERNGCEVMLIAAERARNDVRRVELLVICAAITAAAFAFFL